MKLKKNIKSKKILLRKREKEYPENYDLAKIEDLFKITRGKVISSNYILENKGIYPVYSSASSGDGSIGKINTFNLEGKKLTWTTDGFYAGSVFFREGKYNCTNVCGVLELKEKGCEKYFSYLLKPILPKYVTKTDNRKLMSGTVSKIPFIYNNKVVEQEKIAQVLSQQEEQVNNIQKLIEKLEKRNQYYAERLLSGELRVRENEEGNVEFYENDSKKTFEFNRKIIKHCFNNNIETWHISKFKDFIKEREKSKISVKEATNTGEYPFFNCSSSLTYTHNTFNFKEESLILSTGGLPSVHYCNKPFANSSDTYVIYSEKVDNKYLYYYLKHNLKRLESCFQGSGLKHLNKKLFKLEKLYLPLEIKEQKRIANVLDKLNSEANNLKFLLEKEQKRFEWLSDALLSGEYQIVD